MLLCLISSARSAASLPLMPLPHFQSALNGLFSVQEGEASSCAPSDDAIALGGVCKKTGRLWALQLRSSHCPGASLLSGRGSESASDRGLKNVGLVTERMESRGLPLVADAKSFRGSPDSAGTAGSQLAWEVLGVPPPPMQLRSEGYMTESQVSCAARQPARPYGSDERLNHQ